MAKVTTAKTGSIKPEVTINFPKEGEVITGSHYAFQAATNMPVVKVEISLNDGEWQPCRESLGLWWHDWKSCNAGAYTIKARAYQDAKTTTDSVVRKFSVKK